MSHEEPDDELDAAERARREEVDAILRRLRELLLGEPPRPVRRRNKLARRGDDDAALRRARKASAGKPAKPWDWDFKIDLKPLKFDLTKLDF